MQTQIVGTIVALSGNATQKVDGQIMQVELEGPVYKGAVLVTEANAHLEVRFTDDTMLSQGQNSQISIDNYVFDANPNVASSILLNLTEGTLRTITGKIAEENPEKFEIKSPLTTLGIRGTDLTLKSSPSEGDTVILNDIGSNHFLVVRDLAGSARYLNIPDTFVDIPRIQSMGRVRAIDPTLRESLLKEVPFSNTNKDGADDQSRSEHTDDAYAGDQGPEGTDQDNIDQQVKDIQDAIASGDFSKLEDTAAGGNLPDKLFGQGAPPPFGSKLYLYNPVFSQFKGYSFPKTEWTSDSDSDFLFPDSKPAEPPAVIAKAPEPTQQATQQAPEPPDPEQPPQEQIPEPIIIAEIPEPEEEPLKVSPLQILFIGTDGDDLIIGNQADNIIYGAGGADTMYGRGGDDRFVVWGSFESYEGQDEAGNDLAGGSSGVPHLPDLRIDGESDYDTLIVYGDADFTATQTVVTGIERVEIHSVVSFRPDQFAGVQDLVGLGDEEHIVNFENEGEVNLSAIEISGISQIGLGAGITAVVDEGTLNSLGYTDSDTEPNTVYSITGNGTIITTDETDFSDFVDKYNDDIDPQITLGRPPTAEDDYVSTDEDDSISIAVLTNDTDLDKGDELTLLNDGYSQPSHGTVALGDNTFTYTPDDNFYGEDSFTYTISDYTEKESTATVTVTVNPVNDPPVANNSTASVDEDQSVTIDVTGHVSDIDGDPIAYSIETGPSHGTLIDNANGTFTYSPDDDYNGADSFVYQVDDGNGGMDTATVNVTVAEVNDPPVANDSTASVDEDQSVTINVTGSVSDIDNDPITYFIDTGPSNGNLSNNNDGTFTYTPDADYNGLDSFVYQVDDGSGGTDTATVNITIGAVNDPPVANDSTASVDEDQSLTIDVTGHVSDIDGDPIAYSIDTGPSHGTLIDNANGTFAYSPDDDYNGADSFVYQVDDGNGGMDTATVNITVANVNDPPVAEDSIASVDEDQPVTIDVTGHVSDIDNDAITYSIDTGPSNGTLMNNANGTFTYTPDADYNGPDSFVYQVDDGNGGTDTATVDITVNLIDDPSVVTLISYTDPNGITQTADMEKDSTNGVLAVSTLFGSLLLYENGDYNYSPDSFFSGTATLDQESSELTVYGFNDYIAGTTTLNEYDKNSLVYTNDSGVGINGGSGSPPSQINHNANPDKTEAVAIEFKAPVDSATVTISDLFINEGPDGSDESGYWEAFDQDGNLINGGYIYVGQENVEYQEDSDNVASVTIDTDEDFQTIVFSATYYVDSTGQETTDYSGDNSSDYYLYDVTWDTAEVQETMFITMEGIGEEDTTETITLTLDIANDQPLVGNVLDPQDSSDIEVAQTPTIQTADLGPSLMASSMAEPEEYTASDPQAQSTEQQPEQTETVAVRIFGDETEVEAVGAAPTENEPTTQVAEVEDDKNFNKVFFGNDPDTDEPGPPAHAHGLAKGLTDFGDQPDMGDTALETIPTERIDDQSSIADISMDLPNDDSCQSFTMDDAASFDADILPHHDFSDDGGGLLS